MANENKKTTSNEKGGNSTSNAKIIRSTCKWFRDTIDTKNPTIKKDLSLKKLQDIATINPTFAQWLYGGLANGTIPANVTLKKMSETNLKKLVEILKINITDSEDVEDYLNLLVDNYQNYLNKNAIEKRVTSAKLKLSEVVFYIAKDLNKAIDMQKVVNDVKDINWSIKNIPFDTAKYLSSLVA